MKAAVSSRHCAISCMLAFVVASGLITPPATAQGPRRPPPGFRPPPPRPPVIVNNYSNNGSGLAAGALGFGVGMLAGAVTAPRPAPNTVVVTPPASSVIVTRPATPVIVTPSQPSVVVSQPAPSVVVTRPVPSDQIAEGLKMLNGRSYKTRRDGAMILGRTRAQAAVGPLMDKLRNDKSAEVRKAAAWALAEIGDTSSLDYLEKTAQFDHSPEVRAAARTAQQRLLNRIAMATPVVTSSVPVLTNPAPSSPPLPPPAPQPAPSTLTSGEQARSTMPRATAPGITPNAVGSGRVPSLEPRASGSKSPFFDPPAAPAVEEPALQLSPPAKPLDVP